MGTCLAALTAAFPVTFLEPPVDEHNPYSVYAMSNAEEGGTSAHVFPPKCPSHNSMCRYLHHSAVNVTTIIIIIIIIIIGSLHHSHSSPLDCSLSSLSPSLSLHPSPCLVNPSLSLHPYLTLSSLSLSLSPSLW